MGSVESQTLTALTFFFDHLKSFLWNKKGEGTIFLKAHPKLFFSAQHLIKCNLKKLLLMRHFTAEYVANYGIFVAFEFFVFVAVIIGSRVEYYLL